MDAFGNWIPNSLGWGNIDSNGPKEHLTGKLYDEDTRLYYFHARWYDPEVGRFVSRDPGSTSSCSGGNMGWGGYQFVANNPIRYRDPSGRWYEVDVESCGDDKAKVEAALAAVQSRTKDAKSDFCKAVAACSWWGSEEYAGSDEPCGLCDCYNLYFSDKPEDKKKQKQEHVIFYCDKKQSRYRGGEGKKCKVWLGGPYLGSRKSPDDPWTYPGLEKRIIDELTHCCRGPHKLRWFEDEKDFIPRLKKEPCDPYWVVTKY
jgi:RHS repeat-associated protein